MNGSLNTCVKKQDNEFEFNKLEILCNKSILPIIWLIGPATKFPINPPILINEITKDDS